MFRIFFFFSFLVIFCLFSFTSPLRHVYCLVTFFSTSLVSYNSFSFFRFHSPPPLLSFVSSTFIFLLLFLPRYTLHSSPSSSLPCPLPSLLPSSPPSPPPPPSSPTALPPPPPPRGSGSIVHGSLRCQCQGRGVDADSIRVEVSPVLVADQPQPALARDVPGAAAGHVQTLGALAAIAGQGGNSVEALEASGHLLRAARAP